MTNSNIMLLASQISELMTSEMHLRQQEQQLKCSLAQAQTDIAALGDSCGELRSQKIATEGA